MLKSTIVKNNMKPISESVKALSHTPQYRMHKYFARRPYNVFENLIKYYSKEGDLVLDVFCGGGVTVFESCKNKRNAVGVDLNPLSTMITELQMFNGDIKLLKKDLENFCKYAKDNFSNLYHIILDDDSGSCLWIEWAYVVSCPKCGEKIVLIEKNKIKNGIYECPNKKCVHNSGVARTKCLPNGEVPIRVKYLSDKDGKERVKTLSEEESLYIQNFTESLILEKNLLFPDFSMPLNWDRQLEDKLLDKGVKDYKDLFSKRNFYILTMLFNHLLKNKEAYAYPDYCYFLFSSALRYTNKMSRVTDNWEGGNPTCMDKHAYWLPNEFIENNVVNVLFDRSEALMKGCKYSKSVLPVDCFNGVGQRGKGNYYKVYNQSSSCLPLPDECVDVVITDPPYGSNVQYAELSVVWNGWYQIYKGLDSFIYKEEEAVSNRKSGFKGAKTESDYEELLYKVFRESYRVLKKDRYLVFTFNNKNLKVWIAMLKAVARSGFVLPEDGILFQDYVDSYKNTSHLKYEGNIQGDFIYSFKKTEDYSVRDYKNVDIKILIEKAVEKTIDKVFDDKTVVTTSDLYKNLFNILASELMHFIIYNEKNGINLDYSDFGNKYVDSVLERKLVFENGVWERK